MIIFLGNLNGKIPVIIGDVETELETKNDSPNITIFEGLFAAIELPKDLNTSILINMNFNTIQKPYSKEDLINMDSLGFEKQFDVYAKDKILAMRILTSSVLTYLIDFKSKEGEFDISIKNNQLYIQLERENSFEINISKNKNAVDYDTLNTYYKNLEALCELINFFYNLIEETDL